MAFTPITQAAIDSVYVPRAAFGQLVKDDLDDHETRILAAASAAAACRADLGTWSGGTAISRLGALETITGTSSTTSKFGASVGTGSNVTTGSATAQLTDLRTRALALENAGPWAGQSDREANAALPFGTSEVTVLYQVANLTDTAVAYSAGTFTFSKAGRWLVVANSSLSTVSANGIGYAQKVKHNGTAKATSISVAPTTGFGASASTSRVLKVAATDTMTVTVVGSALAQGLAGNANTNVQLVYQGP